jgi:ABC-type glycerol-3-phosphate transport system substrate-binding protein
MLCGLNKRKDLPADEEANVLDQRMDRRKALSTAGKVAAGVVVAGVVAGGLGYFAGSAAAPPVTVTQTIERTQTVTQTVTATEVATATETVTPTVTATEEVPPEEKVTVTWGIWSWGVELVEDNARIFNKFNPDINLQVIDYGLDTFFSALSNAYTAGNPPNFHYSTPDVTYIYLKNGWAVEIERYFPEVRKYLDELFPGFRSGFIHPDTGLMHGLAYYGGSQPFMYNQRHLDEAGIDGPPETWEDLVDDALKIKEKEVNDDPVGIWYGSWGFVEVGIYDFMLGINPKQDMYMWDEDLNPIFNAKGSPLFNSLRWQLDAIYKHKIASVKGVEYDEATAVNAFGSGAHTYFWMPDYDLAFANLPPSKEAGNLRMGISPGTGLVSAIYRSYLMSKHTVDQGEKVLEATWRAIQFVGGKTTNGKPDFENGEYFVCKRLNNEKGVGPIYRALWQDESVRESMKQWVDPDVRAQVLENVYDFFNDPRMTTWWSEWWGYWQAGVARPAIHALILGQEGTSDDDILRVLNRIAEEWNKMKAAAKA